MAVMETLWRAREAQMGFDGRDRLIQTWSFESAGIMAHKDPQISETKTFYSSGGEVHLAASADFITSLADVCVCVLHRHRSPTVIFWSVFKLFELFWSRVWTKRFWKWKSFCFSLIVCDRCVDYLLLYYQI